MGDVTPLRPDRELLTRQEMAAMMRVGVRTFDGMRAESERLGLRVPVVTWGCRRVLFRPVEVLAWGAEFERLRKEAAA